MSEPGFDFALDENMVPMFEAIRETLAAAHVDPYDRDAFLMHRTVVELIHDSRPVEGLGEGIDEFIAYTHLLYLYWSEGKHTLPLSEPEVEGLLGGVAPPVRPSARPPVYFAIPPRRRIWGSPTDLGPEPLDGWFAARRGDRLLVAAQFGGRPDREDISVVAVDGPEPGDLRRADGSPLFHSTLPAGTRAGLYSLTGMEELLALAWRVERWRGGQA